LKESRKRKSNLKNRKNCKNKKKEDAAGGLKAVLNQSITQLREEYLKMMKLRRKRKRKRRKIMLAPRKWLRRSIVRA
jgi:hypothetical protein